ncbi:prepilin peptidase [Priestia flexa]|uniref:prepilin peptidase n=1 Tax=Priestia flexa TaxID=86664 RepID=UPI0039B538CB
MTMLYIFTIGLVLGSFYNVVGLRIPIGKSIVKPRSSCPKCQHVLTTRELLPVLSYIVQIGKCRHCSTTIPIKYPIIEFLTGILFVLSFQLYGFQLEVIVAWTLISLLIIIVVSDLSYMLIPNKVLLFFLPFVIIQRLFIPLTPWWDMFLGGFVGFTLLLLISLMSKGGMGGGDIKLYGVLGLILGCKLIVLSFFLAALVGTSVGLLGMAIGKVQRGKPIPFGPSIATGTLVAYYYGDVLINWYFTYVFNI